MPCLRALFATLLACAAALLLPIQAARAADIGISPVAVHLDRVNDRATVNVVNSGNDAVVMQVEAVAWRRVGQTDQDAPTNDMVINPSVFTVQGGQTQLVRVGLRRAVAGQNEGTYRIVLREVPQAPRPGEVRVSGQVRVLMALRVPVYVAPQQVVRDARWQAAQQMDGSVIASLRNDGNVHERVGKLQLRAADGTALHGQEPESVVVFPGEERSFRLRMPPPVDRHRLTLEVATAQGPQHVPVASLAQR